MEVIMTNYERDKLLQRELPGCSSVSGSSQAAEPLTLHAFAACMPARRILSMVALGVVAVACAACSEGPWLQSLRGGEMLVTTAEQRAINQTPAGAQSVHGRVTPKYITCAEPSPDVAKAVSTAFSAGASGGVTLPSGVTADVAAAVSRARAEALVQLGERLATIQLLRDGLHSACEAYANGAITDTTYAVMLSRFDKTMVTMLVSELAAGAFGRSLAAAGAGSEGHASASADLSAKITKSRELEKNLEDTKKSQEETEQAAKDEATNKEATDKEAKEATDKKAPDQAKKEQAAKEQATKAQAAKEKADSARKDVKKAEQNYTNSVKAAADSAANVSHLTAGGGITASNNPEIAKTLAEIQRKYIENLNFDALEVACISALDRGREEATLRANAEAYGNVAGKYGHDLSAAYRVPKAGEAVRVDAEAVAKGAGETQKTAATMAKEAQAASMTPLAGYCLSSVLPMIQAKKGELLNAIVIRAETLQDTADKRAKTRADMRDTITEVKDYVGAAKDLLDQVKGFKAIEIK
jgi:hypothetical protein